MDLTGRSLTDMLKAMAAQQQMYTVPAYPGMEAAYGPYQYVAQVAHPAYITAAAPPQQVLTRPRETLDSYERYDDSSRHRDRDRRDRRERERERDHRRDRDRDRHRRDRHRDRSRDRDRPRDGDRDRYRDDESPRNDTDYDKDSLYDEDTRNSDYKSMPPNNTIMVRGLAQHILENDIRADILACSLTPKDIRLVRKKESGASRGFAFVEFSTVTDATQWMETKQGILLLQDVYRATLQYSIPKDATDRQSKQQDWFCVKCGAHNFKRRDSCFKCSTSRSGSEPGEEGTEDACSYPTNTLLLRGLDVLSTEESVLQSIQHASSDLPIRSVRIGRDALTNTSRGVCYVELNSVLDSMQLFNKLNADPPVIDNKEAAVAYCKLSQNTDQSSGSSKQTHQPLEYTAGADIDKLAEYSASVYAQTPEEHASYVEYYTVYYQQQAQAASNSTQSDSVNAAAAVAQSALQAMQQKSGAAAAANSQNPTRETTTPQEDYPTYPPPDVSTYKYDESSGYYYDPSTTLYYDATSTYYYNGETGQYLYWDAERSTYLPAPTSEDGQEDGKNIRKEKDKQDKVKVAKKIAKDMERWAKAQNKRNETVTKPPGAESPVAEGASGSGAADAAFAVLLERRDRPVEKQPFQMHVKKDNSSTLVGLKKPGLVAAYGGENSDSEEDKELPNVDNSCSEEMLVDVSKMACLLCKRQFPTKEALTKHVQLSSLHKTNLEAMVKASESNSVANALQYRDRAKERRAKYGLPNQPPPPNRLKERYIAAREEVETNKYEEPTKEGLGENNIGNKLLKKMGWSDGMGLGKSNQGRTNIIEAERRVSSAGLGMQGSNYAIAGDSYKDCVKKMMVHRYQELDAAERSTF